MPLPTVFPLKNKNNLNLDIFSWGQDEQIKNTAFVAAYGVAKYFQKEVVLDLKRRRKNLEMAQTCLNDDLGRILIKNILMLIGLKNQDIVTNC
ncbi:MAG: hypothetical protein H7235_06260 [Bdellovibrionaceae bacterium]|nr:hypothetical protein [Pseudobdellovibrionaceae bacterium]